MKSIHEYFSMRCCTSLTAGGTQHSTWTPAFLSPRSSAEAPLQDSFTGDTQIIGGFTENTKFMVFTMQVCVVSKGVESQRTDEQKSVVQSMFYWFV